MWKGERASRSAVHHWMLRHFPKGGVCEQCGRRGVTDWANIDHRYRRVRRDWHEWCRSCHQRLRRQSVQPAGLRQGAFAREPPGAFVRDGVENLLSGQYLVPRSDAG
jgi:hypothetical protein